MSHRPKGVDGGRTDQGNQKCLPRGGGSEMDMKGQGRGRRKSHLFRWVEMFGKRQESRMSRVCATVRRHLGNEVGGLGRG